PRHRWAALSRWVRSWVVVQAQFLGDPVERPGELLAEGLRTAADLLGDRGPIVPLVPQREDLALVEREPAMDLLEQVARGHLVARVLAPVDEPAVVLADGRVAAVIPALGVLLARLGGELLAGHRRQELEQLLGGLQLVLARGGPHEEAGQDRLADVDRIE